MRSCIIVGLIVVVIFFVFAVGWLYGADTLNEKLHTPKRESVPTDGDMPAQFAHTRPTLRGESYYMERGVRMCSKCHSRDHDRDDCPEVKGELA